MFASIVRTFVNIITKEEFIIEYYDYFIEYYDESVSCGEHGGKYKLDGYESQEECHNDFLRIISNILESGYKETTITDNEAVVSFSNN